MDQPLVELITHDEFGAPALVHHEGASERVNARRGRLTRIEPVLLLLQENLVVETSLGV